MIERVEERVQMGKLNARMPDGTTKEVDVPLTIVDTYHDDGRKDVLIKVPRLQGGATIPKT